MKLKGGHIKVQNHVLIHFEFVLLIHHSMIGGSVNDRKWLCHFKFVLSMLRALCSRGSNAKVIR